MSDKEPLSPESSPKDGSFLGEILSTIENPITTPINPPDPLSPSEPWEISATGDSIVPPEKPKRKSLSSSDFLRIIGAIFFVTLIFFGTFLAFIVFNPGQAQFFIGFGINPGDIASLLKRLVSGIFGGTTFLLSIAWIIFLFRAILTKKEYKKKKTISIILALFFGALLFSEITLWAFLVQKINATDYENPNGGVIVYDNDKLLSDRFKNNAVLGNFDNLIGPMELKFDLKSDANFVSKSMNIEDYKIDFDGARCQGKTSSIVEWVNPQNDQNITCIFDEAKVYKPTGVYTGTDRVTHKPKSISINFHTIHIIGIVDIKKPKTYKDHSVSYDASSLVSAGFRDVSWYTEKSGETPVSKSTVFSIVVEKESQLLCLNIFPDASCDKLFFVPGENGSALKTKIVYQQDKENPLKYLFHLENSEVANGEITQYQWFINNINTACTESTCSYVLPSYQEMKVVAIVSDSAGNTTELSENISASTPLKMTKALHSESFLEILDSKDKSIISDSYNNSLLAYVVTDINMELPTNLYFNATDVKVDNFGYELTKVEWDFDNDGIFEKEGLKAEYELIEEKRYTIRARYTFTNREKNISSTLEEKIIVEPKKKDISISMKLNQDSEYAPTNVHVDGSASIPKKGTITKFMYDFGEGRGAIEWDAVQDYHYSNPGEYIITFTVVRDDGEKEQTSRKIVLKDTPKRIVINTSVSSGIAGKPIDFNTMGTIGEISSYKWDFGDGQSSDEQMPSHTYEQAWKYTVKITVIYADKTVRSTDLEIEVKE